MSNEIKGPETFHELKKIADEWGLQIPLKAPFTPNAINELTPLLRLPLPESAIQESKATETRKGYDTTGYSYQAHVDRMNWIFGPAHWKWRIENEQLDDTKKTHQGRIKFEYSGDIHLEVGYYKQDPDTEEFKWVTVHKVPPIPTDHESMEKGSARKGMMTKGIKRSTSILGVGADAYLGVLDDDLITGAEPGDEMAGSRTIYDDMEWEERPADRDDLERLKLAASRKGFTSAALKQFYRTKSEGQITADITSMKKGEMTQVIKWLAELPDKEQETAQEQPQEAEKGQGATDNTQEGAKDAQKGAQEATGPSPDPAANPKTLVELQSSDEATIRRIAAEYSFTMPGQLNDRNRAAICKTLATLMGLPNA